MTSAEVVSDSLASLFDCCESPSTRFHRATSILHDNLGFPPLACSTARTSQSALARDTDLHGRVSLYSANSVGDVEAWEHRFCVSGGLKALTSGTWCRAGRSAEKELAPFQQNVTKVA